jgi:hypothetical protein
VPLDTGGIELELELDPPHAVIASRLLATTLASRNFMPGSETYGNARKSSAHEETS